MYNKRSQTVYSERPVKKRLSSPDDCTLDYNILLSYALLLRAEIKKENRVTT